MRSTVFDPYRRFEGEEIRQGINYCNSIHFDYVIIRRGDTMLEITIPKKNPKDYSITEITLNKWDQKLWL